MGWAVTEKVRDREPREIVEPVAAIRTYSYALSLARRLVRILDPIVQPLMPTMLNPQAHVFAGSALVPAFIGDHRSSAL